MIELTKGNLEDILVALETLVDPEGDPPCDSAIADLEDEIAYRVDDCPMALPSHIVANLSWLGYALTGARMINAPEIAIRDRCGCENPSCFLLEEAEWYFPADVIMHGVRRYNKKIKAER